MPIIRERYSDDWPQRARVLKDAAGWTCQQCDRPCRRPEESWAELEQRAIALGWGLELHRPGRFVLTTAHIDQNPANNDPANLAALCSSCHLRHDTPHRTGNRQRKREYFGQLPLLGNDDG
ncbi:hypothetical protein IQ265_12725 [Nodosilinea sp. LEGE 06152]|uniref:hypothetical protein n=1 Tax=Nodosilinea sp. LEGE 06152 TaxID=2777966 RepID=UPI001882CE62|nr:hypothetical protein [Nodosilinea sp. LEGE 06152]MBE9157683.1 hypothetical protein [Nodosilinea sp. LEGE 06152]